MADLYVQGHRVTDIAAHFGVTHQAVSKLLRRYFDMGILKEASRKVRAVAPPPGLEATGAKDTDRGVPSFHGLDLRLAIRLRQAGMTWGQVCRSGGLRPQAADALRQATIRHAKSKGLDVRLLQGKARGK